MNRSRLESLVVDVTALFAVLTFVTGGIFFRFDERPQPIFIDLRLFGPWLLFAALAYWLGRYTQTTRVLGGLARWLDALTPRAWRTVAVTGLGLLAIAHTYATLQRHLAFETGMDLTIYANACRNWLFSTTKGDVWLFADHFEPVLALFAPLCQHGDPAIVLLIAQGAGLAAGSIGIARLARCKGMSRLAALGLAILYVQNAAVMRTIYYDFHLLAFAIAVYPWLWYAVIARRWLLAAVIAVIALGLKESVGPTLAGFGAYLTLDKRTRVAGVVAIAAGLATFIVVLAIVYPRFRGGEGTMYFGKYYGHLGSSFGDFAHTVVTRPFFTLGTLLTKRKLSYLVRLIAMTGFVVAIRPRLLLPALPAILINVLASDYNLFSFHYHYEAEIMPMLACAVIADAPKMTWGPVTPIRAFIVAQLFVLGFSPIAQLRAFQPSDDDYALQAGLEKHVPKNLSVAANQRIAAHLTENPKLYLFDYLGHEFDYLRADVVVTAYPSQDLGFDSYEQFEQTYVPLFDTTLLRTYEDPWLRGFRIWRAPETD